MRRRSAARMVGARRIRVMAGPAVRPAGRPGDGVQAGGVRAGPLARTYRSPPGRAGSVPAPSSRTASWSNARRSPQPDHASTDPQLLTTAPTWHAVLRNVAMAPIRVFPATTLEGSPFRKDPAVDYRVRGWIFVARSDWAPGWWEVFPYSYQVDPRIVANPEQARNLLPAVSSTGGYRRDAAVAQTSTYARSERHTPAHTRRPRPQRFRW